MTTDKARAEAERLGRKLFNEMLYDFKYHGATAAIDKATATIAAALTARDAEASAKLARVEAALAKWQHEAEGLREAVKVKAGLLKLMEQEPDDPSLDELREYFAKYASACKAVDANPIAKAALDAAGGAQ